MLHQFRVKATDIHGNVGVATMYEWETIDTTPPDTQLLSWPSNPSGSSTARFEFTATDNITVVEGEVQQLEFECRLNDGNWFTCVSPANLINVGPGLNTFEVRALDAEGNVDPSPAGYAWTVLDGTPPQTTITSSPPAMTQDTSAAFQFSSSESGSTFACSLDSADVRSVRLRHRVQRPRRRHPLVPRRGHRLGRPRRRLARVLHVDDPASAGHDRSGDVRRPGPAGDDAELERDALLLGRASSRTSSAPSTAARSTSAPRRSSSPT